MKVFRVEWNCCELVWNLTPTSHLKIKIMNNQEREISVFKPYEKTSKG